MCRWSGDPKARRNLCVQSLTDEDIRALTGLVSLRGLSLSGATGISGEGLAALKSLSALQVDPLNVLLIYTHASLKAMTPLPWYDCVSDCGVHTPAGLNLHPNILFLDSYNKWHLYYWIW